MLALPAAWSLQTCIETNNSIFDMDADNLHVDRKTACRLQTTLLYNGRPMGPRGDTMQNIPPLRTGLKDEFSIELSLCYAHSRELITNTAHEEPKWRVDSGSKRDRPLQFKGEHTKRWTRPSISGDVSANTTMIFIGPLSSKPFDSAFRIVASLKGVPEVAPAYSQAFKSHPRRPHPANRTVESQHPRLRKAMVEAGFTCSDAHEILARACKAKLATGGQLLKLQKLIAALDASDDAMSDDNGEDSGDMGEALGEMVGEAPLDTTEEDWATMAPDGKLEDAAEPVDPLHCAEELGSQPPEETPPERLFDEFIHSLEKAKGPPFLAADQCPPSPRIPRDTTNLSDSAHGASAKRPRSHTWLTEGV